MSNLCWAHNVNVSMTVQSRGDGDYSVGGTEEQNTIPYLFLCLYAGSSFCEHLAARRDRETPP